MAREMKNSGIEWIGDIPVGWSIMPHKYIMHKEKSICEHYNGENIISLTMNGVVIRDLTAGGKMPTTFDGYQYVEPNDLLLCLFDIDVTPRCVGIVKNNGITSPAYSRFKVHKGFYNAYYDYLLRFIDDEKVFIHLSKNLRSSLTETDFGAILSIVPPFEEQQKIASFLDQKCTEIDAVIEKTKATIEEYKKLKQSVITEAVTKGIRGNRPMKDSGIEWIGEIPVGWETSLIKYSIRWKSVKGQPEATVLSLYRDYGVIPKDSRDDNHNVTSLDTSGYKVVSRGDFVINKMKAWQGSMAISDYEGIISPAYHICEIINPNLYKKYFHHLMRNHSYLPEYTRLSTGMRIGQWDLGFDDFKNIPFIIPPIDEQKEIVEFIENGLSKYDYLIERKTILLTELETYKKSLIYEYVTGKKEVGEDTVSTQVAVYSPYFPITINSQKLFWVKMVLMAKILEKFNYHSTRVKLQKTIFVIQNSIGFDLDNEYVRAEFGPLDNSIFKCENTIKKRGWIKVIDKNGATNYKSGENKEAYKKYYDRYFAEYDTEIDRIINIFKDYDAKKSERIATLFGAWNDAIIDKRQFTDEDIVEDVLNNWHEHKGDYSRKEWLEDLEEMKRINLIPKGYGKKTVFKKD